MQSEGLSQETQTAVLADQVKTLVKAFDEHRVQYKEDQAANKKSLQELKSALDMAKGGYFVLAAIGMIVIYATGVLGKILTAITHWGST